MGKKAQMIGTSKGHHPKSHAKGASNRRQMFPQSR